jgi:hypothetical protein
MGKHRSSDFIQSLATLALFGALATGQAARGQTASPPSFGVPPTSQPAPAPTRTEPEAVAANPPAAAPAAPRGISVLRNFLQRVNRPIVSPPQSQSHTHDLRVVRAGLDSPPAPAPAAEAPAETVKAVAKVEGVAAPGLRIKLTARESVGLGLRYLWVQTRGPEVKLERADDAEISFIVPGEATELAFQLIVAGTGGVDRTALVVPLQLHARPSLPAVVSADAGDDQMAIVGHRVTLNGVRCRPRDQLAYRWIYVSGPPIRDRAEEAWLCSFVPTAPGLHRFLLVVATEGVISKPDEVIISVVAASEAPRELQAAASQRSGDGVTTATTAAPSVSKPLEALTGRLLTAIEPDGKHARDLAGAFNAVADRISLYDTYADLFSEISRRLDRILPADTSRREAWDQELFEPLSDQIVAALKPLDLDPSRDADRSLNSEQKRRLEALFREIASGFQPSPPAAAALVLPAVEGGASDAIVRRGNP